MKKELYVYVYRNPVLAAMEKLFYELTSICFLKKKVHGFLKLDFKTFLYNLKMYCMPENSQDKPDILTC